MFAIIGILIVILAVAGGYLMEKGHLLVLMQPAELLIIGGAAIGTMLIANPVRILKAIVAGMGAIFGKPQIEALRQYVRATTRADMAKLPKDQPQ